jgi:outer membrane protein assembly factor BamB
VGRRVVYGILAMLAVVWPQGALAQSDAGWTQYQAGPGHPGSVHDGPAPGYRLDWSAPITLSGPDDQFGASAPIVAGDTVIVVGPEQVVGVDLGSGESSWSVDRAFGPSVPAAVATVRGAQLVVYTEGFGDGPPDPDASPSSSSATTSASGSSAPSDGDDAGGVFDSHLAAFDLETQKPSFEAVPLDAVSRTGVTVDGSMAFVGANGGRIYAVDLTDGSVAWTAELGRPVTSPVAVADGKVLVGMQSTSSSRLPTVVALDAADGEELWRVDDEGAAAIVSTVAADATTAYVAFSGSQESSIDAIDLESGSRTWHARLPRLFDPAATAPPVITDDAVLITDALGVTFALDPADGTRRWDFALNQNVFRAAPVAVGDHVLVGTVDGDFVALDAADGELVWRSATGSPIRAIAVGGDRILLVRAGVAAGLEAYVNDPGVPLVREASPTTADPAMLAFNLGVAGVAVAGLTLLLGRVIAGRMGPAMPSSDDPSDPDDDDADETGPDDDGQERS